MSSGERWRRRSVLAAGVGLAGVSLHNIATSSNSDVENATSNTSPGGANSANDGSRPLKLGWTAWSDAEVVSLMAANLIENQLNVPVERVMADIGIQYESLARGDLDLMLMAWLPKTHRDYWVRVRDRVLDLGPMYTGRLGWIVPDYVPTDVLDSIEQLAKPAIAARFNNRVQGIDPGSGLNQASLEALKLYGLKPMELVASSSAAMAAVLSQAIKSQHWMIATSWTPHWMFARYKLRFLKDPKRAFGGTEWIHALARIGLDQTVPQVTQFLSRFQLPNEDLDQLLLQAQESTAAEAVDIYLKQNPERVRYWVTGKI
ncbi:MAG: glycine/betaine ABC transporter substrate-binding protein [Cyanobium sp. NAT70]|nr:glycine/betaine ABC transporter substrate-binding protein [Cyanobium sp. NAT70]|tara:strand:+ start:5124 stop:6074 length:951 start_codon:yes stop_codon:yes gene_type:complete